MSGTALQHATQINGRYAELRHTASVQKYRCSALLGIPIRHEKFLLQMPKGAVCAEIGVFRGHFSRAILRYTRPQELHLVDPWWEMYGDRFPDWGTYTDHGRLRTRHAYAETLKIVARYGKNTNCEVHVGQSFDVLERFPDAYFDWVYLDSSHQYEETMHELEVLSRKVKPGRLITGDDFIEDPADVNHGCSVAVREFCEKEGWRLGEVNAFNQWTISRR